jgi:hypothetical protein
LRHGPRRGCRVTRRISAPASGGTLGGGRTPGARQRPLYRGGEVPSETLLSIDGSGRYPIIVENGGNVIGWVHRGSLRSLKLGQTELDVYGPAW